MAGHVLHVHVPPHGRLDRAASDASFARARAFFWAQYPDQPVAWFFCTSWMLDPQVGGRTSLQRAYVSHLRSGRHWYKRAGVTAFPATGGST